MLARILSAFILVPAALAVVFFAPPPVFLAVLGLLGSLCLFEYFRITDRIGISVQRWFGYAGFWFLLTGFYWNWLPTQLLLAVVLVSSFLAAVVRRIPLRDRVLGLMANLAGISYMSFCLYPAVPIRFDFGERLGLQWLLILLAVIWSGDIAALAVGRTLGRTHFAPAVSPKKTNEGAVGGILGGLAAALVLRFVFFADLPLLHVVIAALLLGAFGQIGDLAESLLKRAAEVKDSSSLIPGHGGVLDRIDSMLFAFPVLYLYLLELYG